MDLRLRGGGVELVGGEEVGHDGFEAELGCVFEELEERVEVCSGCDALAGHSGVDFEMDRDGLRREIGAAGGGGELFQVVRLPDGWSEAMLQKRFRFAAPETGHDVDARLGAERADGYALFDGGDAEPLCAFGDDPGGAEFDGVAVGVGFDDGDEGDGRAGERAEGAVVVEQAGARDFCPDGTGVEGWHVSIVTYAPRVVSGDVWPVRDGWHCRTGGRGG